jgi:ATP-dependent Zn protease
VTIIPRSGGALGFAQYLPKEVALFTRDALVDRMCMALGGRAAEELIFGRVTTGASDDLDKVTQLAYSLTTVYGMNARVGQLSFPRRDEQQFDKPYSEATARVIDEEVRALVETCYARTRDLLALHADKLRAVAELLLERETISQVDLARLAGERPFKMTDGIKEYLSAQFDEKKDAAPEAAAAPAAAAAAAAAADDDDAAAPVVAAR